MSAQDDDGRVERACLVLGRDWRPVRQHTGELVGLNGYARLSTWGRGWRCRFDNGALHADATGARPAEAVEACVAAARAGIKRAAASLHELHWKGKQ